MADLPAFTRIPNDVIEAMPELGNAELRVLLAIARKTYGWQKECDVISVSQLADMTGLTSRNTQSAITALLEKGLIARELAGKQRYCYTLRTISPRDTVVGHIPTDTISPRDTEPYPLGTRLNVSPYPLGITQKKDLKERKERDVTHVARTPSPSKQTNIDSFNEAVIIYKELSGKKHLPPTLITLIVNSVSDLDKWRLVIESWASCGYNVGGVKDMLDWYDHPEKMAARMARSGRPQPNGYSNGQRPPADLPLVTATAKPTPEERRAAADRYKAILDERSAGK